MQTDKGKSVVKHEQPLPILVFAQLEAVYVL